MIQSAFYSSVLSILLLIGCTTNKINEKNNDVLYTCSMDPQIIEHHPGKCPICKMELTRIESKNQNQNSLTFSNQQLKLGNIKVDILKKQLLSEEVNISAKVVLDETKSTIISSRIMGRIEVLNFKSIGEKVKKGDLLYQIYSEDLASVLKDLFIARERMLKLKDKSIDYKQIYLSTKNKLILWGLNENQIHKMEKKGEVPYLVPFYSPIDAFITEVSIQEGESVMQGQVIYKLNDLSTVWVEAQTFLSETTYLKEGQKVKVSLEDDPSRSYSAEIKFISPEMSKGSQVNIIRVELKNTKNDIHPGMLATLSILLSNSKTLVLPLDAVLQETQGNTIWIQNDNGSFENRMVKTGRQNSRQIEILSGVKEGQKVVFSGAYLINSEYRLKKGANPMEGHDMKGMKM